MLTKQSFEMVAVLPHFAGSLFAFPDKQEVDDSRRHKRLNPGLLLRTSFFSTTEPVPISKQWHQTINLKHSK